MTGTDTQSSSAMSCCLSSATLEPFDGFPFPRPSSEPGVVDDAPTANVETKYLNYEHDE